MKRTTASKFGIVAMVVGMVGLVLTFLLPSVGVQLFGTAQAAPTPAPSAASCVTNVTYYATTAPPASNNFGPNQTYTDVKSAQARLDQKLCSDPLFAATMVAYERDGLNLNAANVEATATAYNTNKLSWNQAITTFKSNVVSYTVENDPHTYQTLGMVPHGSAQPSLIRSVQNVQAGYVLVLHLKNGAVRKLRIVCDLQPVESTFPNVPTPPAAPPAPPAPPAAPPAPPVAPPAPPATHVPTCQETGTCYTPPPTHTPTCQETGTCYTPPPQTCYSAYGPGYNGTYPNCTKNGGAAVQPAPPAAAPGPNPAPVAQPPASKGGTPPPTSSQCYDGKTGQPVPAGTPGAWCS